MKKTISLFIVFVLLLNLIPTAVFANSASKDNKQTFNTRMYNVYLKSGKALYTAGSYKTAIVKFNKALSYSKGAEAHYYKGLCYLAIKDYEQAMNNLDEAVMLEPEYIRTYTGSYEEEKYTNEYLGLTFDIAKDWEVMDIADFYIDILQLYKSMEEEIANIDESEEDKIATEDSIKEISTDILSGIISKYPMDSDKEDTPAIIIGLKRISEATEIEDSKSYILQFIESSIESDEECKFEEIKEEKINSIEFCTVKGVVQSDGEVANIKMYATEINGYVFYLGALYVEEAEFEVIESIINSIIKK